MQLEYINKSTFWKIVTINFKSKRYQYTLYSNLETSNWAKQPMLPHTQNFDKTFTMYLFTALAVTTKILVPLKQ